MNKKAVIVVDLQNEYLSSGKLPLTGIEATLENAARIIADATNFCALDAFNNKTRRA